MFCFRFALLSRMRQRQMLFYRAKTRIQTQEMKGKKYVLLGYTVLCVWNWRNNNNQSFGKCFNVQISKSISHKHTRFCTKWKSIWAATKKKQQQYASHHRVIAQVTVLNFQLLTIDGFSRNSVSKSAPEKYK